MAGLLDDARRALWALSGGDPVETARDRADPRVAPVAGGILPETEFLTAPASDAAGSPNILGSVQDWLQRNQGMGRKAYEGVMKGLEPYGDAMAQAARDALPDAPTLDVQDRFEDTLGLPRSGGPSAPAQPQRAPLEGAPVLPAGAIAAPPMLDALGLPARLPSAMDGVDYAGSGQANPLNAMDGLPSIGPLAAPTAARDAAVPKDMILGSPVSPQSDPLGPPAPAAAAAPAATGGTRHAGDVPAAVSPMSSGTAAGIAAPNPAPLPPPPDLPSPYEPTDEQKTKAQDDALLRVAMALMATNDPNFASAVGKAGLVGIDAYDKSLDETKAEDKEMRAERDRLRQAQLREYAIENETGQRAFQNQLALREQALKERYRAATLAKAGSAARGGGRSTNAFTFFENERQRAIEGIVSNEGMSPQDKQAALNAVNDVTAELTSRLARNPAKEDPLAALLGGGAAQQGIDPADLARAMQGLE